MKTRTIIILFFLVLFLGCSVEVKKEFYPDGKVKAEMRYKKGKLEGISKGFYESGKLKVRAYFKDGTLTTATCYDENEKIIPCPKMKEGSIDEQ
jgi:antitoxin component YwqK of YwqJK toxin-antitoxin module